MDTNRGQDAGRPGQENSPRSMLWEGRVKSRSLPPLFKILPNVLGRHRLTRLPGLGALLYRTPSAWPRAAFL